MGRHCCRPVVNQAAARRRGNSRKTSGAGRSDAAQTEHSARVLPCLTLTVPMETKLRQLLPQLRRGCLAERHPNPPADNLGEIEQTRIAGFQKLQNFRDGQGAVFLPRLGINRQTIVWLLRWRFRCCGVVDCSTVRICSRARLIFLYLFSWSFFFCSAVRLLSVALHEKAEPPALPRGSALQKAPRAGGLVLRRRREGDGEKRVSRKSRT